MITQQDSGLVVVVRSELLPTSRALMDSFEGDGEEKRGQQVLSAEVHSKVVEAFEVFDHENNKTVDVREVSPSLCPIFISDIPGPDRNHHTLPGPLSQ